MEYEDKKETDTEQELCPWIIRFEGYIEIKAKSKTMPSGYPLDRRLFKVISEEVAKYPSKYRLYDYTFNSSDQDNNIEFESDD